MPREGRVVEGYEAGHNSLHEWVLLSKQINFSPVTCCKWDILGVTGTSPPPQDASGEVGHCLCSTLVSCINQAPFPWESFPTLIFRVLLVFFETPWRGLFSSFGVCGGNSRGIKGLCCSVAGSGGLC